MRKVSTRFIRVPRRHRSNTSRWYFWTESCLFVCPGHLVRTHSTHRVFPLGVCHPPNSLPISPLHTLAKASSTTGRVPSIPEHAPPDPDFSPPVLLSNKFSSSSSLMRVKRLSSVILIFQVRFLKNPLHLQPWREPLEFFNRVVDPTLGVPIGNILDPTSRPADTSWLHACRIQDNPMPLVSTAACGVPFWTESSVPSCGCRLFEYLAIGPCPQVDSCSFLRDTREAVPVHLLLIKTGLWSRPSIPSPTLPDGVVPLPAVPSIEGIRPSWDCRHPIVTWETGSSHRTGEDTRSLMECGIEPSGCRASVIGDVEPACKWSVVTCPVCWHKSVSLIRLLCRDVSRHRFFPSEFSSCNSPVPLSACADGESCLFLRGVSKTLAAAWNPSNWSSSQMVRESISFTGDR